MSRLFYAPKPHPPAFLIFFLAVAWMVHLPFQVLAQPDSLEYETRFFVTSGSGDRLPFWLGANQYGVIDPTAPAGYVRFSTALPTRRLGSLSYSFGTDLVGRVSRHTTVFLQQLFGEIGLGPFLLRAGRKQETAGGVPSTLSLGSMMISPNAAPITRISISWPEWVSIPQTGDFVSIKGRLSHGWVGGNRVVDRPYLHEKNFYLRLGSDRWGVHGWGGIVHFAMWGGMHPDPSIGRLPSSFLDFLRVFFAQGASEDTMIEGEITNVLGNSVGVYDFGLDLDLPALRIRAYRQFYLEDTVSLGFRNGWDGLWGLWLHAPKDRLPLQSVLYEHVNTKRQGSRRSELEQGLIGTDNYYNHFVYSSGWTHRGRSIGMPLILTQPGFYGVTNNILLAHHLGFEGWLTPTASYRLLWTYTRNYGAHSILPTGGAPRIENARFETPVHQYAVLLDLTSALSDRYRFDGFLRLAYDWGDLLPDHNFGVSVGVVRRYP